MGNSPTMRRRRLAAVLKRMREDAGIGWDHCDSVLGFNSSKMSRIEAAVIGVSMADAMGLVRIYGYDNETIHRIGQLARKTNSVAGGPPTRTRSKASSVTWSRPRPNAPDWATSPST